MTFREEPLTALRDQFRIDVEEILFRHAERAEQDPVLAARLRRVVRLAMRASILEKRLGGDRVYRYLREVALHWASFRAEHLAVALRVDRDDAKQRSATKHETVCPLGSPP